MWFMKKKFNGYEVVHSDKFDDLKIDKDLPYPFTKEMLKLLKQENKFEQEYYYIKKGEDFAFFTVYKNRMNIFTYGKAKLFLNIDVVGFPCSLSNSGYVTNNEKMLFDFITKMKGAKLILNVDKPNISKKYTIGNTLPTCVMKIDFKSIEEYLASQRSSYRRRINIAIENCKEIEICTINDNSIDVYELYLNTYNKSNYKLEKLEKGFFENVDATKLVFMRDNKPIGFTLVKKSDNNLIFMLCGMDYNYDTTDLYYYMLYTIVDYALKNNCKTIDFGQTSEETKMKLGAVLQEKYFYAHHSNALLNCIAQLGKNFLEYKYKFPNYRVFKEKKDESITC